ncbi:DNA-methyltransferase [Clostridium sp. MT-14]|uniref:DNA-methyltransferase n=1 Tax=Clostridium sp. MT-14 TaxID=3348360 RepID=UPI0035F27D57
MDKLISKSIKVDAIITDEPYGTTQCKWDEIIPFDEMWERIKLLRRNEHTPTILFGSEPFSSRLRLSNLKEYKYDWVWDKVRGVGHLNAKKRPMMNTENILVFYKKQAVYNPQMRVRNVSRISKNNATQKVYGKSKDHFIGNKLDKKYPINLITFSKSSQKDMIYHPTQKPIALMEYLINTYTNDRDLVLDFTMGSGTTGVACKNLNRRFIGIEKEQKYYNIAVNRISNINK